MVKHLPGKFRALGNIGDVLIKMGEVEEAVKMYQRQLSFARQSHDRGMEAAAYGALGLGHRLLRRFDKALGYHTQELTLRQEMGDLKGECRAHGNLGAVHMSLGNYTNAMKCYQEQLERAKELKDNAVEAQAFGNLGIARLNMAHYEDAIGYLEQQLATLEQLSTPTATLDKTGKVGLLNKETRFPVRELKDKVAEADAACGLGAVYQQMGEYSTALQYHQADLDTAEELGLAALQGRACGNLGTVHESRIHHALGNTSQAVAYLQQGLQIAEHLGRREEEARIRHRLGLALWGHGDLEGSQCQLERAAHLLETIRRESRGSSDYKLSLFDLQTVSYQALQLLPPMEYKQEHNVQAPLIKVRQGKVLVSLGRQEEALLVAERGRTRAFVDLLLERQNCGESVVGTGQRCDSRIEDNTPTSVEQLVEIVNRQKASVLYYSLAAGYLYSWFIVPSKGVVRFHQVSVSEAEAQCHLETPGDDLFTTAASLLEHYIQSVRDSLGVELHSSNMPRGSGGTDMDTESSDMWPQHLEELGDRSNQDSDRVGFMRIMNRNHLFNSSNYSLSSLFSLGSVGGSVASGSASRPGSTRSKRTPHQSWQGPACLGALYQLLIAPFEDALPSSCTKTSTSLPHSKGCGGRRELLLVLEGELYLVPFPLLKPNGSSNGSIEYLCERFSLLIVPSLTSLRNNQKLARAASKLSSNASIGGTMDQSQQNMNMSALVVGNPSVPCSVTEQWGWGAIPYAEQEAAMVAEMLQAKALVTSQVSNLCFYLI
uniref:CHAT domain-containing protein n=1 Tax=Timema douglasi TaxID=61478 RepID=A0A7R8VPG8_TIMDO|nr:unnamed protein product [Timema douglasi]